jgi:hypothetical protein
MDSWASLWQAEPELAAGLGRAGGKALFAG